MKVLFVHDYYQSFGGEDAVVENELLMLDQEHIQTKVYSRYNSETREFAFAQKAAFPLTTIHSHRTERDLAAILADFKPDVAYVHNIYPLISPAAYTTFSAHGVPIVQVMHNFRPFCANGILFTGGRICERCLEGNYLQAIVHNCMPRGRIVAGIYAATLWRMRRTRVLDKVDRFICLTKFSRDKLIEVGLPREKLVVRGNWLDTKQQIPQYEVGDYALYLGRLSTEKGLRTLIAAARLAPQLPVVIAGTGYMEDEIRATLQAENIANVQMVGFQTGEGKQELLRRAKFLVICSEWYETFGMVILEAFAAGKPVVGSRLGSIAELVEDGVTGFLFEPANAPDLARAMLRLSSDSEAVARMGRAGRSLVETHYGREVAGRKLIDIFEDVIARRTASRLNDDLTAFEPSASALKDLQ